MLGRHSFASAVYAGRGQMRHDPSSAPGIRSASRRAVLGFGAGCSASLLHPALAEDRAPLPIDPLAPPGAQPPLDPQAAAAREDALLREAFRYLKLNRS